MQEKKFVVEKFRENLFRLQDLNYKKFQAKLLPTLPEEKIIGVKVPELKKFAKNFFQENDAEIFLKSLPHKFLEENYLHDFLLNNIKDFEICLREVKIFLPQIDCWAICDSLIPKIFSKNTEKLFPEIENWLASEKVFTVRFGILMLLKFYLDKNFDKKYLQKVAEVQNKNYYVEMAAAWFFAEALIKQYDAAIIFLEQNILSTEVRKKTIQKAVESFRISDDKKIYLKSLRKK